MKPHPKQFVLCIVAALISTASFAEEKPFQQPYVRPFCFNAKSEQQDILSEGKFVEITAPETVKAGVPVTVTVRTFPPVTKLRYRVPSIDSTVDAWKEDVPNSTFTFTVPIIPMPPNRCSSDGRCNEIADRYPIQAVDLLVEAYYANQKLTEHNDSRDYCVHINVDN